LPLHLELGATFAAATAAATAGAIFAH